MKSLLCAALLATLALAEDDIGQLVEQHEPTEAASSGEIHHTAFEALADVQYATNGPVQQGFSISRLWFGVTGRIDSTLDYRFFATETRDLSAIQLPFLLPREVSLGIHNLAESGASIRVGLFRPWLNPYWSEMRMEFPGYFGIHSTLLQGEQMGVEGVYPIDSHIEVGVGMNNGNGVFALNTNNSRGFTFFVRRPRRGEDKPIGWGASIYSFRQSAAGASNYRENWVGNLFAEIESAGYGVKAGFEFVWGGYSDNASSYSPQGWAGHLYLPFLGGNRLMLRAELLNNSPDLGGRTYKRFEMGPVFHPTSSTTLFLTEQYTEPGTTSGEVSTFLLLRAEVF